MRGFAVLGFAALMTFPAFAVEPGEALKDPALEARARDISGELRCLVCQNQSIDDSQASLAKDLRLLVRERISAGDSDEAVKSYLVARYGDFILLKPPFKVATLMLWAAPFSVLALGGLGLALAARRRRDAVAAMPEDLSAEERERLYNIIEKS